MNYDAWDIDIFYGQKFEDIPACEIRCTEDGPLRMKISFVYRYRASLIEQELMVYSGNRRIDFATKADWHEDHRLLKPYLRWTSAPQRLPMISSSALWNVLRTGIPAGIGQGLRYAAINGRICRSRITASAAQ